MAYVLVFLFIKYMFDTEKFIQDWPSVTQQKGIRYCLKQGDYWFLYDDLFRYMQNIRINRHRDKVKRHGTNYQGRPCAIHRTIRKFIEYGFLQAHPQNGLRLNKDYIPTNQQ